MRSWEEKKLPRKESDKSQKGSERKTAMEGDGGTDGLLRRT